MAAIAMSLLSVAVAGSALGGALLQKSTFRLAQTSEQRDMLVWAEQAVQGFAAVHGRLPCPARMRSGPEDCTSGQAKGWLPLGTLLAMPDDTRDVARMSAPHRWPIRYMVNRTAGGDREDMAVSQALFQPAFPTGERPAAYPTDTVSTLDLCERLEAASGFARPWRDSSSAALDIGTPVNVEQLAFGIAVAAQGASDAASGLNADFAMPMMESAWRPTDSAYSDKVTLATPSKVHEALGCNSATSSLDAMALAAAWVDHAAATRVANMERARRTAELTELGVMSDAFYLVDSLADLSNGVYNMADNTRRMVIAALKPTLWPYVPVHQSGISKGAAGVALSAVDTARNTTTLALRIQQARALREAAEAAASQRVWDGALQMLLSAHQTGLAAGMGQIAGIQAPDL
ncbi:MAG: hypothetical protein AB7S86_17485 [Hydrogenophaga sp.]|uniref:hypothetical protein n=1 Tax=Hydrogenophaga sp. TaxID=1904254 RepID=UPI003D0D0C26